MRMLASTALLMLGLSAPAVAVSRGPVRSTPGQETASVIHPRLHEFMTTASSSGRMWIQFADRGSTAGTMVPLSQRAIDRRVKRGVSLDTPERQPVAPEYVEAVRRTGARIHRISRWFNAVSVDYEPQLVERVAAIPGVASIRPVVRFRRPVEPPQDAVAVSRVPLRASPSSLSYGGSAEQIQQINADIAHSRGYSGAGVLVAMFDTGFRKDHLAFAAAMADGRLIDEWDFVFDDGNTQNEPEDNSNAHSHGTSTWSILGGQVDNQLYGPAYGASFLLAKTEDIRSETQVEEDNWLAAVEWADSLGADVISSSLTYSDWYVPSDYDGLTAITTLAADLAATLSIVVCNSAGNAGPASPSIGAPVDAFNILSIGSVQATGTISSFSSRGPTFDGRIKPEVCARGSDTWRATSASTATFASGNGTSFSCPLVGGGAALILEAHTDWNALMVREALMQTADHAHSPDNTYGWGIIDVNAAIDYEGSIEVNPIATGDTVYSAFPSETVSATATAVTSVDAAASSLYYRVDGGSFVSTALTAAEDTLQGSIPQPAADQSTIEYYFVIKDVVGFSARSPEALSTFHSFVWQTMQIGDINRDGSVTSADVIQLVDYVFKSGPEPQPLALGDVNGVPPITSADIVYLVNYIFKGGPPPVDS